MASATLFDPLLHAVLISALVVTALTFTLLIVIVLLRFLFIRRERRLRRILDRWRPLLARAAAGEVVDAPQLDAMEGELLLPLWNRLRESIRGESEASLDAFAHRIGLDGIARSLLASGNTRSRLLAINTLGHIGVAGTFDEDKGTERTLRDAVMLERLCVDNSTIVSLAAARALLRLDSTWALPRLVPQMVQREDWSMVRLLPMLRVADTARLELVLADILPRVEGSALERLLLIAAILPQNRTAHWARMALEKSADVAIITAALRLVGDPRDAPIVRRYLQHPSWQVRVRAVTALARVADTEDLPRLITALSDPEWWVRLRAARALTQLPFIDREYLARLCETVSDRFARDALLQVIAEARTA